MKAATKNNKLLRFTRNFALLDVREVPSCWEWAEAKRIMPGSVTAKPGPYRTSITPYVRGIQESFDDDAVQVVIICLASRLGKTESFLNLMGRTMDVDPSNILVAYPTIDAAKIFFNESVQPMIDSAKCFRGKVSSMRKRDGANTQLKKKFPGGTLRGIGANVPSAFRGVQARIVIGDEIDAMEPGKEGDPIDLLFKRAENYPNAVQVLSSTPTVVGTSRIWQWLEKSDMQKLFVPSPFGDHWHVLDWANVKWDEGKPETARYVDPETGDTWTERQRMEAIAKGEWRATQPFTGLRGFWGDGLISMFPPKKGFDNKLHQFATEFLQAKANGAEALQVWHNTFRALPWEEEKVSLDWQAVQARAEQYDINPLPDRIRMITLGADVQLDRIEYEWVGWTDAYESYGLTYGVIPGDTKQQAVWDKFAIEIRRKWQTVNGLTLRMARGFVDEGNLPESPRKFCLAQLAQGIEVYPSKGLGRTGVTEPESVSFKANKTQKGIKAPTFNVGVNRCKRSIYAHMLEPTPGANTMHFPEGFGYDDAYFQMLTAEKVMTKYSYGKPYKVFECPKGARNEALDCRVYAYAAALSLNPQWDALRENIRKQEQVAKDQAGQPTKPTKHITPEKDLTPEQPTAKPVPRRREGIGPGNSWVSRY